MAAAVAVTITIVAAGSVGVNAQEGSPSMRAARISLENAFTQAFEALVAEVPSEVVRVAILADVEGRLAARLVASSRFEYVSPAELERLLEEAGFDRTTPLPLGRAALGLKGRQANEEGLTRLRQGVQGLLRAEVVDDGFRHGFTEDLFAKVFLELADPITGQLLWAREVQGVNPKALQGLFEAAGLEMEAGSFRSQIQITSPYTALAIAIGGELERRLLDPGLSLARGRWGQIPGTVGVDLDHLLRHVEERLARSTELGWLLGSDAGAGAAADAFLDLQLEEVAPGVLEAQIVVRSALGPTLLETRVRGAGRLPSLDEEEESLRRRIADLERRAFRQAWTYDGKLLGAGVILTAMGGLLGGTPGAVVFGGFSLLLQLVEGGLFHPRLERVPDAQAQEELTQLRKRLQALQEVELLLRLWEG